MTDVVGNPEEERRAEFYYQPWAQEAVCRYFYSKVSVFLSLFSAVCHAAALIMGQKSFSGIHFSEDRLV